MIRQLRKAPADAAGRARGPQQRATRRRPPRRVLAASTAHTCCCGRSVDGRRRQRARVASGRAKRANLSLSLSLSLSLEPGQGLRAGACTRVTSASTSTTARASRSRSARCATSSASASSASHRRAAASRALRASSATAACDSCLAPLFAALRTQVDAASASSAPRARDALRDVTASPSTRHARASPRAFGDAQRRGTFVGCKLIALALRADGAAGAASERKWSSRPLVSSSVRHTAASSAW